MFKIDAQNRRLFLLFFALKWCIIRDMRLKTFMLWIGFLTVVSLISLTYILTNTDPYNTTILTFILFYLSFFVAAAGLFILIGFYLRRLFIKNKVIYRLLRTSFRQGILIAIILTGLLLLWTLIK